MTKNTGFSLLQVLVAMGLASGLAVYLMKLNVEQKKTQNTALANIALQNLSTELTSTLGKSHVCSTSLNGLAYRGKEVEIESFKSKAGSVFYSKNQVIEKHLRIVKMNLGLFTPDDPEIPSVGMADLTIHFERLKNVYGGKSFTKVIRLNILLDDDKNVLDCAPLSSGIRLTNNILPVKINHEKVEVVELNVKILDENNKEENKRPEEKAIQDVQNLKIEDIQKMIENNPQLKKIYQQIQEMQKSQF